MKKSYIIVLAVLGIIGGILGGSAGHKTTYSVDTWDTWFEEKKIPGEPMVCWHKEGTVEYDQDGNLQLNEDEWESWYTDMTYYGTSAEAVRR